MRNAVPYLSLSLCFSLMFLFINLRNYFAFENLLLFHLFELSRYCDQFISRLYLRCFTKPIFRT